MQRRRSERQQQRRTLRPPHPQSSRRPGVRRASVGSTWVCGHVAWPRRLAENVDFKPLLLEGYSACTNTARERSPRIKASAQAYVRSAWTSPGSTASTRQVRGWGIRLRRLAVDHMKLVWISRGPRIHQVSRTPTWTGLRSRRVAPRPRTTAEQNRHALYREPSEH